MNDVHKLIKIMYLLEYSVWEVFTTYTFIATLVSLPGNSMDRGAWQATVHGFTESLTHGTTEHMHAVIFGFSYLINFHKVAAEHSAPGPILINTVI